MPAKLLQSCLTLCNPMDCSPPGSSLHGILQARKLEWVAIPFYRGSSQPRVWIQVSCIAGGSFTLWATREAHTHTYEMFLKSNRPQLIKNVTVKENKHHGSRGSCSRFKETKDINKCNACRFTGSWANFFF